MAAHAIERYVLGPPIAAGGMGTVHIGRIRGAEGFSRVVAIKCLRAEFAVDSEHVTMFIDEAQMASRIRHANVVPTLDVCRSANALWIVMEYVAGESLARLVRGGPIAPDVALAIFHDTLAGLEGAHTATDAAGLPLGLVHRDVSPQNILVGVDGVSRIVDFGIAKARNRASITREGEYKGKFGYTAPEVVQGKPATERADVYAAAVTLWEALVGRQLFVGENESTILYNALEWVPTLVSVAAPQVGTAFDTVIARALEKDPDKRFGSAREMLDALESCGKRAGARDVARALTAASSDSLEARAALVRTFEAARTSDAPPTLREDAGPERQSMDPGAATIVTPIALPTTETPSGTVRLVSGAAKRASPPSQSFARFAVPVLAGIAAAIVLLGAGVFALRSVNRASAPPFSASAAPSASADGLPTASTDAAATAAAVAPIASVASAPPPMPAPSASEAAAPVEAASRTAPRGPRVSPPRRTPVGGKGCEPPFSIDAFGDKHYKPECFR